MKYKSSTNVVTEPLGARALASPCAQLLAENPTSFGAPGDASISKTL